MGGEDGRLKNATIYDVAREAGLSIKTVSRVMNHDPTVKPTNRDRVLAAVEALAYSPSLSARSLAGARSFVIVGFLDAELTMHHWRTGRGTDYVSRLQSSAIGECRAAGYHFALELIDHDPARLTHEVRAVLLALKPDGILLTPPNCDDPRLLELLESARVRYARLGSDSPLAGGLQLRLGERAGAAAIATHLIDHGHRHLGIVLGPTDRTSSLERLVGFRDVVNERGLPLEQRSIQVGDFTFGSGLTAMHALMALDVRPTAVFACNDEMALGCLAALEELGLTCPGDVSIAGFDDSGGARFSRPRLTTVRTQLPELTALAIRRLLDHEAYRQGPRIENGECLLIVNASTGPPR